MSISVTLDRLLKDDDFVLGEVRKIQQLYALKTEIRYGLERETELLTESVAEHIYGMHCLCDYYLPLIDQESDYDEAKIRRMIQYHDVDEVETGDIPNHLKTESAEDELAAVKTIVAQLPEHIQKLLLHDMTEYHEQKSMEARFVKALDKHEPAFQCYSPEMKKVLLATSISLKKGMKGKADYLAYFPLIQRVNQVIADKMIKEGFFVKD